MSYTPMDLRNYTVPGLRRIAKELTDDPTSKLRKAELIDLIVKASEVAEMLEHAEEAEQELASPEDRMWAEDLSEFYIEADGGQELALEYDASVGEPQVFQGAMHEANEDTIGQLMRQATEERQAVAEVDQMISEELGDLAAGVSEALSTVGLAAQAAARKLTAVAWAHQVAVVRSMERTVRGKVVDTVLREPGPDGTGRVCLVVEHEGTSRAPGHAGRRTLHALADVRFEPDPDRFAAWLAS